MRYGALAFALGLTACTTGEESTLDPLDEDIQRELAAVPDVQVWADRGGLPLFVTGTFGDAGGGAGLVARFYRLTGDDLVLDQEDADPETGRTALQFSQVRNGLPVVGAALRLEATAAGVVDTSAGDVRGGGEQDVTPAVSADRALAAAIADPAQHAAAPTLVYRATDDGPRLAWQVSVETSIADTELVYVSALDGTIIDRVAQTTDALARKMYVVPNTVYPAPAPGTLKRVEGGPATGDAQVDTNYDLLGKTHRCFALAYGRDSYNGTGGVLVSSVHGRMSPDGTGYNAFWTNSLKQMVYGDETPAHRSPAFDLDVTAHEIGHGITFNTSRLEYLNESGAINEGLSDIYGATCDAAVGDGSNVFQIGEDSWTKAVTGDALRYMNNPTRDGSSRDFYPERYLGTGDHGGVHTNSGIVNLAAYLMSEGGKHPRGKSLISVKGIGLAKVARIFHRANTNYLTPKATFRSLRAATMKAALTMYGPAALTSVALAWSAVGVK